MASWEQFLPGIAGGIGAALTGGGVAGFFQGFGQAQAQAMQGGQPPQPAVGSPMGGAGGQNPMLMHVQDPAQAGGNGNGNGGGSWMEPFDPFGIWGPSGIGLYGGNGNGNGAPPAQQQPYGPHLPPGGLPGGDVAAAPGLAYDVYGGADYAVSQKERAFHALWSRGYVPLASEPGLELARQGNKARTVRLTIAGQPITVKAFRVAVKNGAGRRRRKNLTGHRLAEAAWVHRKLASQVKLAKKFAAGATKTLRACAPRSSGPCKAVRKTTCRKR